MSLCVILHLLSFICRFACIPHDVKSVFGVMYACIWLFVFIVCLFFVYMHFLTLFYAVGFDKSILSLIMYAWHENQ